VEATNLPPNQSGERNGLIFLGQRNAPPPLLAVGSLAALLRII